MKPAFQTEHDSMGELQVPAEALWGAQTQRAVQNFPISGQPMPRGFIQALGLIKAAAAEVNAGLGLLPKGVAKVVQGAALRVAAGEYDAHFPIDIYQTGSGTSSNMNANEVIARLASAGGKTIHANDHVNLGQSSNDVIPTAIRVSAQLAVLEHLLPAIKHLRKTIDQRGKSLAKVVKTGRTHLMDAMPLTFQQEFSAWSAQLSSAQARIEDSLKRLRRLPLGGTAIGTGINADPRFGTRVARALSLSTKTRFESAANKFEGLAAQDDAVELSGQLSALAVALMKIANDLRWMNSGPLAGLGEIELPTLQPGSSIMPGKVNPVIPEATVMVCAPHRASAGTCSSPMLSCSVRKAGFIGFSVRGSRLAWCAGGVFKHTPAPVRGAWRKLAPPHQRPRPPCRKPPCSPCPRLMVVTPARWMPCARSSPNTD